MSDLINHLEDSQYRRCRFMVRDRLTSFSYGMPRRADGRRFVNVVCTIADVAETPQTVPNDRIRYTVEADTAWSNDDQVSDVSLNPRSNLLTSMIERSQRREQDCRINDTLTEVRREDVDKILPSGIFESERHDQRVAESHQYRTAPYQSSQPSPSRHDNTGNDTTDWRRKRWYCKASTSCGRGVEKNDLEEQWQHEQILVQLLAYSSVL